MSQARSQSLQFSIDETIWLRNGYEADEILSLALDPDISIEETSQYVAIKGALRLTGEYKPTQGEDTERTEEVSYRVVDEVTETEDGTTFMEHHFPVDITIPANRVKSIEDVYVTVDALDYTQPNKACIQLQADISISGLVNPDLQAIEPIREEVDASLEDQEDSYDPLETVSYESYREPEEEIEDETPQIDFKEREEEEESDDIAVPLRHEMYPMEDEEEEEEVLVEVEEEEPEEEVGTGFKQIETPTKAVAAKPEYPKVKEAVVKESVVSKLLPKKEVVTENVMVVEDEDGLEVVDEKTVVKRSDENALYLTKMLTSENERFAKMKICIVQEGDNLESIAERYKVPVSNILRRNQLPSESLDEGQVLYIPVKG